MDSLAFLLLRISESDRRGLVAYAEKSRKSQTKVVRALIRKLPTYEADPKLK